MTEPQRKALQLIDRAGGEILDRAIDGRVAHSLERRGWVARSLHARDHLIITADAREQLTAMMTAIESPVVRNRDPSSKELVENIIASEEDRVQSRRIPDFADVEPENDGMTEVCCHALEIAIVARVVRVEVRTGRVYVSGGGKHWLMHFCPFCGEARKGAGGKLDVDE